MPEVYIDHNTNYIPNSSSKQNSLVLTTHAYVQIHQKGHANDSLKVFG